MVLEVFIICGVGGGHPQATARVWRSDDTFWELGPSFDHVGSGDQTQGVRLSGKCHCLLSHLNSPESIKKHLFLVHKFYFKA